MGPAWAAPRPARPCPAGSGRFARRCVSHTTARPLCIRCRSSAEVRETQPLANLVEQVTKVPVRLGEAQGGPIPDGTRFVHDFGFRLGGLADYLSSSRGTSPTLRSILEP